MKNAISIHLRYFAILCEQRGLDNETLSVTAQTAGNLYQDLTARYGFTLAPDRIKVAINGEFSSLNKTLKDGDEVVFLPPFAGG